jgi:hypothetical protein
VQFKCSGGVKSTASGHPKDSLWCPRTAPGQPQVAPGKSKKGTRTWRHSRVPRRPEFPDSPWVSRVYCGCPQGRSDFPDAQPAPTTTLNNWLRESTTMIEEWRRPPTNIHGRPAPPSTNGDDGPLATRTHHHN